MLELSVGLLVPVGVTLGELVGMLVGDELGSPLGLSLGSEVGAAVSSNVGRSVLGLDVGIRSLSDCSRLSAPVATPNTVNLPHSTLQLRGQELTSSDTVSKETPIERNAKQSTSRKFSQAALGMIVLT